MQVNISFAEAESCGSLVGIGRSRGSYSLCSGIHAGRFPASRLLADSPGDQQSGRWFQRMAAGRKQRH